MSNFKRYDEDNNDCKCKQDYENTENGDIISNIHKCPLCGSKLKALVTLSGYAVKVSCNTCNLSSKKYNENSSVMFVANAMDEFSKSPEVIKALTLREAIIQKIGVDKL